MNHGAHSADHLLLAKRMVAKALTAPVVGRLVGRIFRERLPMRGTRILTDAGCVLPSMKASIFWGFYESAEIRTIRRFLDPDLDVLELGANIGVTSCQILRLLSPGRTLVCVEPNPEAVGLLRRNLELNGGHDARVIEAAVHQGAEGQVALSQPENILTARVQGPEGQGCGTGAQGGCYVEVAALPLSQIIQRAGLQTFALVADIEGAEAGFILQPREVLTGCRQIIMELHRSVWEGRAVTVEDLLEALEVVHGFRVCARDGNVVMARKFPD